ncbi:MAG TPA: hypothetical protein VMH90_03670, partial [Thermoplasmata archaeon]|nr:hypothetical protein [Thermoplasmata archaeon]
DHDGIYVSHDAMDSWRRIGRPLPSDFGFVTATARTRPGRAYFVPLQGRARTAPGSRLQVYRWTEKDRRWSPTVRSPGWIGDLGTPREGLAIVAMVPPGIYLGTTTGQLLYSPDGDRTWSQVPYMFPGIHSVEVSSPGDGAA